MMFLRLMRRLNILRIQYSQLLLVCWVDLQIQIVLKYARIGGNVLWILTKENIPGTQYIIEKVTKIKKYIYENLVLLKKNF